MKFSVSVFFHLVSFFSFLITKVDMKEHRNPKKIDDIEMNKKIFCKKCHEDWGVTALIYNVEWLCIKISSFVLEFPGRDRTTRMYKKWKDLPFAIQEADEEEILRHGADNSETTGLFDDLESWRGLKSELLESSIIGLWEENSL